MPAYRDNKGKWRWRTRFRLKSGDKVELSGTPDENTKQAAQAAEREAIAAKKHEVAIRTRKEMPTFAEWFNGRFWREWVVGRRNKHSEAHNKRNVYDVHLKGPFANLRLDQIDAAAVADFRASLVEKGLKDKTINNILAVLSKPLRYAVDVEVIDHAPRIGLLRVERPEIVCWEIEEYARILQAAREGAPHWYVATCLAGESGLRVGEVKALRWREDVDMVAATITVNQQVRHGVTGTPKGRTRRTIPMTPLLYSVLQSLQVVRTGYVVRNMDGTQVSDSQARDEMYRICRRAGLPERGWHTLRHSFGTHAALFGVNPWRLQTWMGHKRIDETMLYVNVASNHMRPLPPEVLETAHGEVDPDRRILKLLGGRAKNLPKIGVVDEKGEGLQHVS